MTKWQYCVITGLSFDSAGYSTTYPQLIHFITDMKKGYTKTPLRELASNGLEIVNKSLEKVIVAKIIADLGEQGWELINVVDSGKDNSFFFKRPIDLPNEKYYKLCSAALNMEVVGWTSDKETAEKFKMEREGNEAVEISKEEFEKEVNSY